MEMAKHPEPFVYVNDLDLSNWNKHLRELMFRGNAVKLFPGNIFFPESPVSNFGKLIC